jgi:hypothetical protein
LRSDDCGCSVRIGADRDSKRLSNNFKERLNSWGTLRWTIEEPSNSTHFLDLNISKKGSSITTSTFQKPPNLYLYMCEYHNITKGEIKIDCDRESALEAAFSKSLAGVIDPDFDILSSIFRLLSHSPISWKPVHVKGHQDDILPIENLPRLVQLNVEMDLLAQAHLKETHPCGLYTIPQEAWSIWYNGIKLSHTRLDSVYSIVHSNAAREHWAKKGSLEHLQYPQLTGNVSRQQLVQFPGGGPSLCPSICQ